MKIISLPNKKGTNANDILVAPDLLILTHSGRFRI